MLGRNTQVMNGYYSLMTTTVLPIKNVEALAQEIAQHPQANFIYHPAECVMVNEGFSYVTKPLPSEKLNLDAILLLIKSVVCRC
ncbi:putative lipooligosaccharide galactosyltransferase [Actinobacillus pleuropneumoniae]|nr:putative lipooligosaccharide galactosyltransferase [Actinobacillus pleuropneumoniae]